MHNKRTEGVGREARITRHNCLSHKQLLHFWAWLCVVREKTAGNDSKLELWLSLFLKEVVLKLQCASDSPSFVFKLRIPDLHTLKMLKIQSEVGWENCILTISCRDFDLDNLQSTLGKKTVLYDTRALRTYSTKTGTISEEVPAGLNSTTVYNTMVCS